MIVRFRVEIIVEFVDWGVRVYRDERQGVENGSSLSRRAGRLRRAERRNVGRGRKRVRGGNEISASERERKSGNGDTALGRRSVKNSIVES